MGSSELKSGVPKYTVLSFGIGKILGETEEEQGIVVIWSYRSHYDRGLANRMNT